MDREVSLREVLAAREARAQRQRRLLEECGLPLVSFCMNIAGPVKNGSAVRRGFAEGLERLKAALRGARMEIAHAEQVDAPTGCEALLTVRGDAEELKRLCVELEDEDALGRLFDLDVIAPDGAKLEREALGAPPRRCLICGLPGKGCASRRAHPVAELQARTRAILREFFARRDGERIAAQALRALLWEVAVTPKPGLVDRANSGSHRDMDMFTFVDSAAAEDDLARVREGDAETAGQRLFLQSGLRGIRGELADGLPAVANVALPALREALARGAALERAGTYALMRLIAGVEDTNLHARGGAEGRRWAAARAAELTAGGRIPERAELEALDAAFIERNLSPGGCADLLAIAYFLHFCAREA